MNQLVLDSTRLPAHNLSFVCSRYDIKHQQTQNKKCDKLWIITQYLISMRKLQLHFLVAHIILLFWFFRIRIFFEGFIYRLALRRQCWRTRQDKTSFQQSFNLRLIGHSPSFSFSHFKSFLLSAAAAFQGEGNSKLSRSNAKFQLLRSLTYKILNWIKN